MTDSQGGIFSHLSDTVSVTLRGAVVEWLERLGYGAESRRKTYEWASPCYNWKTFSVNPAVNGYLFSSPEPKAPGELIV